jgi:hypothetical protein
MKTEKRCSQCNDLKQISSFYKDITHKDERSTVCISCQKKDTKRYQQTKKGLISRIYNGQKNNSKRRGDIMPSYTNKELLQFALSSEKFLQLYDGWVNSGYKKMLVPTFDRKDDYKGYSFDNFNKWMPWEDNYRKYLADKINGVNNKTNIPVIGTHKITNKVVRFYSAAAAGRKLGIKNQNISQCCKGIPIHRGNWVYVPLSAGGYTWKYDQMIKKN